jgi:hypothetical protein
LGVFNGELRSTSRALRSLSGLLVGGIHSDCVPGINGKQDSACDFYKWLRFIPPVLLFISVATMSAGWLTIRIWGRRRWHWIIGMIAFFGGFIASVSVLVLFGDYVLDLSPGAPGSRPSFGRSPGQRKVLS